jgi:hypothetical protein
MLLLESVACSGRAGHPPVAPRAGSEKTAPAPAARTNATPREPGAPSEPKEDAAEVVARALVETSHVRELSATGAVRGVALSRAEMAVRVRRSIEREVPPEVVASEGEMLVALGVVPPGFDYMAAIVSLMGAELAGYYEPGEKTMYLASDLGHVEQYATLAHELVHALQDQHYDLGKLLEYRPDESDAQSAVHALAEGDATSAMLDQLLAPQGKKATDLSDALLGVQVRAAAQFTSAAGEVPDILKRSLIAPYVDGIALVHHLRRQGGWAAVDRVWLEPPISTEQLLHPEKLFAREAPVIVPEPLPPSSGPTKVAYRDVLGEESLRIVFEEWLPRAAAALAASDWGGDRIAVFRDDEHVAMALHLRYDDVAAAERGERAFRRGVGAQAAPKDAAAVASTVPAAASPELDCVERAQGPLLVARRGKDVAVVAGPYERHGASVASAGTCAGARVWAARVLSQH